jgi:DNA-binding transcriptional MerR regulator
VSSRSYLSIGDVLTLLRQEFPDVTISKIRFLESQGLVNPERTPSGYRKFYEHDVERLRWVLRQQREHFLPLKVIKDRLDDEGADVGSAVPQGPAEAAAPAAAVTAEPPPAEEAVLVGRRTTVEGAEGRAADSTGRRSAETSATAHSGGTTLPGIETINASSNGGPVGAPASAAAVAPSKPAAARRQPPAVAPVGADPTAEAASPARRPAKAGGAPVEPATRRPRPTPAPVGQGPQAHSQATPSDPTGPTPAEEGVTHTAPAAPSLVDPAVGDPTAGQTHVATPGPAAATGRAKGARAAAASAPPDAGVAVPGGASMSLEELATASGLDVSTLEELSSYGLLVGTKVAGQVFYDDECLAVATLAAGFARYGVEPRHLRLYKNAADREAGFVEQIVIPLVRQRNPEARVRAHQTVDELTLLGQQLRASLLRSALSDLLDG